MKFLRKYWVWISALIVLFIAYLLTPSFLRLMGEYLVYQDPIESAETILVLSGGTPARIMEAVDLYREGLSKKIVLTKQEQPRGYDALKGKGLTIHFDEEREMMVLNHFKVPKPDIEVIPQICNSTFSEATIAIPYLLDKGIKKSIIVTSKFNSRRAMKTFRALSGGKVRFIMRPSAYDPFDPKRWWKKRGFTRDVITEYQKLIAFYITLVKDKLL